MKKREITKFTFHFSDSVALKLLKEKLLIYAKIQLTIVKAKKSTCYKLLDKSRVFAHYGQLDDYLTRISCKIENSVVVKKIYF